MILGSRTSLYSILISMVFLVSNRMAIDNATEHIECVLFPFCIGSFEFNGEKLSSRCDTRSRTESERRARATHITKIEAKNAQRRRESLWAICLLMKCFTTHSLRYRTPLSIYFHLPDRRWVLPCRLDVRVWHVSPSCVQCVDYIYSTRAGSGRRLDSISSTNRRPNKNKWTNKIEIKIISFVRNMKLTKDFIRAPPCWRPWRTHVDYNGNVGLGMWRFFISQCIDFYFMTFSCFFRVFFLPKI